MLRKVLVLVGFLLVPALVVAEPVKDDRTSVDSSWIASFGAGLTFDDPKTFLMSPQLEYAWKPNLLIGELVQLGMNHGEYLFTISLTARLLFLDGPLKPCIEGGVGMTLAPILLGPKTGVDIHLGIGLDYEISSGVVIGTLVRANYARPLKTFFGSWPILIGRFTI